MDALGFHFLIELYQCPTENLTDVKRIKNILQQAVNISGATEIGQVFHKFSPHGVSGVILISESHFSIHTWPEKGYAAIDLFTCDNTLAIDETYHYLVDIFHAKRSSINEIRRGLFMEH